VGSRPRKFAIKAKINNNKQLSLYGTKFYVAGKNLLVVTVLVNDKYRQMTEAENTILKLINFKIKI
jgi:hypothetical protein